MVQARRDYVGTAGQTSLSADITASSVSIPLANASGWPTGTHGKFWVVIDPGLASEEKLLALSRSGNTLSLAGAADRGLDGTAAATHTTGAIVEHVFTATDADDANDHVYTTTRDDHTQYTKVDGTRAFTGVSAIAATPGNSAVGDVAAPGTAVTLARSDHVHGREAFATPTVALGTAAAAGAATTHIRSDATIVAFDATVPTTSNPGDSAATGAQAVAARRDHTHGREAAASGATVATSESTSATSYGDLTTPGPAVTVTTGAHAIVILTCQANNSTNQPLVSFAISGATTRAAADTTAILFGSAALAELQSAVFFVALTAGSNTFTVKYRSSGATSSSFSNRSVIVIPLP